MSSSGSGSSMTPPVKGQTYVVQPGDSLWTIAKRVAPTENLHHLLLAQHNLLLQAADINAAYAFRQRVIGGALSHPDMTRSGEFEAAAHHRAMKHRHHRHPADVLGQHQFGDAINRQGRRNGGEGAIRYHIPKGRPRVGRRVHRT